MQPSVQLSATDLAKAATIVSDLLPNLPTLAFKQFRKLNKDTQVGLLALLSLIGLTYAIHYFSSKR